MEIDKCHVCDHFGPMTYGTTQGDSESLFLSLIPSCWTSGLLASFYTLRVFSEALWLVSRPSDWPFSPFGWPPDYLASSLRLLAGLSVPLICFPYPLAVLLTSLLSSSPSSSSG